MVEGDARERFTEVEAGSHDLLVTSPPYLNSFDYSDVYRPEMFLGGFVRNNAELREIRLKTIRSHVQVSWEPAEAMASDLLLPVLGRLEHETLWDKRIPAMVRSYFVDMASVLKEAHRIIRPGGEAWILVSTSAYGGVHVPVDLILADVATHNGWDLTGVYVLRQMRAAGQQWGRVGTSSSPPLRESLILLKR